MRKLRTKAALLAVTALSVPTLLFSAGAPAGKQLPPPKADVYVVPAATDLAINLKYPAQIKSFQSVQVYSGVVGVLEEKFFTEGTKVNKGDKLFKIEDDLYQAKVDSSEASVKMSKASLNNAARNWNRI
jgi:membrane fusion protein (multidrug efflux system)